MVTLTKKELQKIQKEEEVVRANDELLEEWYQSERKESEEYESWYISEQLKVGAIKFEEYLEWQESLGVLENEEEEKVKKIADELANEQARKEYNAWWEAEYGREEDEYQYEVIWYSPLTEKHELRDLDDEEGDYYLDNFSDMDDVQFVQEEGDDYDEGYDYDAHEKMLEYETYLAEQEEKEYEEQEEYEKELQASVAFEKEDGSIVSSIIEKWGRNIEWVLKDHYSDEESALKVSHIGHVSQLNNKIKETIGSKSKKKIDAELQHFASFDEYNKYITNTRDLDCAYIWRDKSWNYSSWIFEYSQSDFGVDILKDESLPNVCLSSTSLKNEPNQSKYFKNFNFNDENWFLFPQWDIFSEHLSLPDFISDDIQPDDIPF